MSGGARAVDSCAEWGFGWKQWCEVLGLQFPKTAVW
jgi:hypothetical protein